MGDLVNLNQSENRVSARRPRCARTELLQLGRSNNDRVKAARETED